MKQQGRRAEQRHEQLVLGPSHVNVHPRARGDELARRCHREGADLAADGRIASWTAGAAALAALLLVLQEEQRRG